jgi:Flp pilus assembly pilin Flp
MQSKRKKIQKEGTEMGKMLKILKNFANEEKGMETVEYAVVGALVIAVAIAAWTGLGKAISATIGSLTTHISI